MSTLANIGHIRSCLHRLKVSGDKFDIHYAKMAGKELIALLKANYSIMDAKKHITGIQIELDI